MGQSLVRLDTSIGLYFGKSESPPDPFMLTVVVCWCKETNLGFEGFHHEFWLVPSNTDPISILSHPG